MLPKGLVDDFARLTHDLNKTLTRVSLYPEKNMFFGEDTQTLSDNQLNQPEKENEENHV